jgi:hypothetical protein
MMVNWWLQHGNCKLLEDTVIPTADLNELAKIRRKVNVQTQRSTTNELQIGDERFLRTQHYTNETA